VVVFRFSGVTVVDYRMLTLSYTGNYQYGSFHDEKYMSGVWRGQANYT